MLFDLLIIALVVLGGWVLSVVLFGPEGTRKRGQKPRAATERDD